MSSHHIVRNNQEPALLVAGDDFSVDVLWQLLEWSPLVICADNLLTFMLDLQVKVDVVITGPGADYEKLNRELSHQQPFSLLIAEDNNIAGTALAYLAQENHQALHILGIKPSDKDWQQASGNTRIDFYTTEAFYFKIKASYSKWMRKSSLFRLDLSSRTSIANTMRDGSTGTYQVLADGTVDFSAIPAGTIMEEILNS